ncbi:MAG TPA: DsbA family oxidoreductase [Actinomycetota bacterium]|nr:DsbA family oxidoreductase [Actinomycetota bacterium]
MKVEVWSDIVCPWCGLGKHRLDAALARLPQADDVEVIYRSFQLDPGAPSDPVSVKEMLTAKYGLDDAGFASVTGHVEALAAAEGLTPYHVGDNLAGNTFLVHQLLAMAAEYGLAAQAWDRVYRAYFGEQRSIFDVDALVELGSEIGLDPDAVREALSTGRYASRLQADLMNARRIGVTGVPFFVIDGRFAVSGAQPPEVLLEVLERARTAAPA